MKKKLLTGSLALGLMAMATPVFAGATLTEYGGTKGPTINGSGLSGFGWDFEAAGIAGGLPPGTLYDNIPTLFGGTATPGGRVNRPRQMSFDNWLFWWNYNKDEFLNLKAAI